MAERTTKSQIHAAFDHYLKAIGKRPARAWNDVGGWGLDYNPAYGGYVIYEVANEGGGQSRPLGDRRRSASAFYDMLWFATRSIDAAQKKSRDPLGRRRVQRGRRSRY